MKLNKRVVSALGALSVTFVLAACGPSTTVVGLADPSPTPSVSISATSSPTFTVDVAKEATAQQGFDKKSIKVNTEVDQKTAKAVEAGHFTFSGGVKLTTPALAAGFIATGNPKAKDVEAMAINQAKANNVTVTHAQMVDKANWVALATGEKVVWNGNTYTVGGAVLGAPVKVDPSGSAVMVFVPPISAYPVGKDGTVHITWVFFMRGACANPQTNPPKPANPHQPPPPPNCKPGVPVPPNGLCPKNGTKVPAAPALPSASAPHPNGTAASPTRPASPDPTPSNSNPVHDVNSPSASEKPNSGSGATNSVPPSNVPAGPSAPVPAPPSPTASGIVTG
jgi:hypothetical protein